MNINVNVTFNGLDELTDLLTNLTQQLQKGKITPTTDSKIIPPAKTPHESEIETVQARHYFCESLFWASQPKQAAKITWQSMPSAPRYVLVSAFVSLRHIIASSMQTP